MKYQQTQSHRNGPNCSVEFSDYSQGEFKTSIQISFNGLQDIPDCVLVDSNDNLYADKSVLELSNDVVNEDLHLIHQEPGTPVKLVLAFKNSDLNALHIKFPPADSLEICKHLSQPDIPAASIKDIVDIGGKGDFYRILEDASQCLPPKEFVQLKDSLIMTVDWMREEVDENKYKSMINILLGQNKGSYLYRNNPRKIQEIIEHYNQNTRLENVHYSQFIQKLLQSVYDYKEIIESKDVLTDEFFIKNSREIDEIFFALYMSLLLSEECVESTKSLVNYWASPVDFDSYSDYKQEAIDIQNREVSKKLNRFRSLLFESANRADHEFKFIVLNYLYWLGRKYNQENQYLDFQPHLFNITLNIATELDGLENLQNKIKYNYHMASGHKAKGDNHRKAGKHYREALAIGQTLHWKGSIANPIRNLVEAEFWSHKENKKYTEGVKRIENQIELVKEHPDLDLNSDEYTIELIKGLKNELEAHRIIKSEGIESAVKQAKSAVGSAIEFYNKAGREELKEGAIGRLIELEAIEAKLETDFGTAAGKHQRYVDELPNSDGADYHRTQVRVCRAKENLIGGKYREAQTELNEISKEVGYVHSRNRPLELLVRAAVDYENGNKTNSDSIYAQLYSDDNDEEHILNIEEDYSSGLTQVIAAQRFQELPIDEDITDFIVDHSIKNTLTSNAVDDISIETTSTGIPTEEVSMENLWRNRLPLNVHNKLQTAELNVQTSFDWDSSIETVMRALEIQMVAVVEYHSKREWGAEWESKIINGGPGNISLGDCFEFFRRHHQETAESLSCAEEVLRKDEEKIVNDISINSIRNILAHGNQLHVADTEQKYNDIHDAITELMRILTDVTPIPAKISKNLGFSNMYYLRLLQKSHNDTVIVSVESELSENDIYYLPPNSVDDNLKLELDDNSILICDYDKGLESVTV